MVVSRRKRSRNAAVYDFDTSLLTILQVVTPVQGLQRESRAAIHVCVKVRQEEKTCKSQGASAANGNECPAMRT